MENVIGRIEEKALIQKIEKSGEPELLAVYGRRRIGKLIWLEIALAKGAGDHLLEVAVSVGSPDDAEEHFEYESVVHDEPPVSKPAKPVAKNSYREYLEMIQQQQQQ